MHSLANFVEVALLDQIVPGGAIVAALGETPVVLFNVDGRVFATGDCCIRCGASLAAGSLAGSDVKCPGCDWQYDVTTGCVRGLPALRIDTFETRIVDSRVLVLSWA